MPFDEMNEDHGGGGDGRHERVEGFAALIIETMSIVCDEADTCAACTAQVVVVGILQKRAKLILERDGEEAVVADLMELVECVLANIGIEVQTDYRRTSE